MAKSSLNQFLALVRSTGLSKTNRFFVRIAPPPALISPIDLSSLALLAESSSLPGKSLNTQELGIYGPKYNRVTGVNYGNTIKITFLVDRLLRVKRLFDDWIDLAVSPNSYNVAYASNYLSQEISIIQSDNMENEIYQVKLIDAFPVDCSEIELDSSTEGFSRIVVTFKYRKWVGDLTDDPNANEAFSLSKLLGL